MPTRLQTPERDREVAVDNSLAVGAHLEQILHVSFLYFQFYLIFSDHCGMSAGFPALLIVGLAMQRA
jgi:hypothetical protein